MQGKFSRINFREHFYVGGYSNYSLIGERTGVNGGLVGCVRRIVVNGKQYDMRSEEFIGDVIDGYDVGQSSSQSVDPFFLIHYSTPVGERSIAISSSVCLLSLIHI